MRHLSKQALARLAGCDVDLSPPDQIACGAMYEDDEQVTFVSAVVRGLTPSNRPTCPQCAVLLDQALEGQDVSPDGAACAARSAAMTSA